MATKKQGIHVGAPEWWRHLRWRMKKLFWKRERRATKADVRKQAAGARIDNV